MKQGRPSPYDPNLHPAYAKALAIRGLTNEEIAAKIGIAKGTLQEWIKKYPDLRDSIKEGKGPADARVEMALYKRALGYEVEETRALVVGNGESAHVRMVDETRHIPADPRSCIHWLNNRAPDRWREKQEIEHTGKDGGPIEIMRMSDNELEHRAKQILSRRTGNTD
ncbi:MAG: hypothetical protein LUQ50_12265 [Methanospirillum sp.]|uniref:helix-turn-helix domain-containing protein n=1 Tax=Methanospirillum sp. TaxID=45200 RepID=UPI0023730B7C|nr:hypothetical protein [Methanospirillum sp.]MDD1729831.1 hypothetical protein [Methanospirillum sp.]